MALPLYDSITAQANVTVTTAAALPSTAGSRAVLLQSDPTNTANIYLGSSASVTNTGTLAWGVLRPGEWRVLPTNNASDVFAVAASSSKLLVGTAL